ncbi:MAG: zinc-ribbon domain-containing protein [Oscillospiraceae bacterium]|nr:zinc-ribbon domain-containing protein [Oscillospiraceae bacterium]
MIRCEYCGTLLEDGSAFCTECGAKLPVSAPAAQTTQQNANPLQPDDPRQAAHDADGSQPTTHRAATVREFLKLPENQSLRRRINAAAIICYFSAVVSLIMALLAGQTSMIVDVLIVLVLGLVIQLRQSRVCSVILLLYAIGNSIYFLAVTHRFSGWLMLVAGISAAAATFKLNRLWKSYQQQSG